MVRQSVTLVIAAAWHASVTAEAQVVRSATMVTSLERDVATLAATMTGSTASSHRRLVKNTPRLKVGIILAPIAMQICIVSSLAVIATHQVSPASGKVHTVRQAATILSHRRVQRTALLTQACVTTRLVSSVCPQIRSVSSPVLIPASVRPPVMSAKMACASQDRMRPASRRCVTQGLQIAAVMGRSV